MLVILAVCLAASFVTAVVLVGVARRLFLKIGFVDHPGPRKIHAAPKPYGGGAAIFATLLLVLGGGFLAVLLRHEPWLAWLPGQDMIERNLGGLMWRSSTLGGVLLAAAVLFVMGLVDDRRRLPAWPKLLAQFAAAGFFVFGLGMYSTFFVPIGWLNQVVTVFWIVAVTNAFNFMDNMDGLSAGVAAIVLAVLVGVTVSAGQIFVPVLAVALLGALLGFLVWNFPPAKIFLGDAGSQTLGFLMAALTIMTNYYRGADRDSPFSPFMPLVLLAVPLYDLASVTLIRLARGQSPFVGDTNHFSHRLVAVGLSRRAAVLTIYLATIATSLGSLLLRKASTMEAVFVFAQTLAILAIIAIFERLAGERAIAKRHGQSDGSDK